MPNIVVTCPGALSSYNQDNFGGALFDPPNTLVTSPIEGSWNNVFGINDSGSAADRDRMLQTMIHYYALLDLLGMLILVGHSRGGQIIYRLLRDLMPQLIANFDPARILLISSGNPERKYGGACVNNYSVRTPVYPGTQPYGNGYGLSTSSPSGPFTLIDIARQYDEWADCPNDVANTTAMTACTDANVHSAYDGCPPLGVDGWPTNWDDWTHHPEGNVHYLTAPAASLVTPPAPTAMAQLHGGKPARNRISQTQYQDSLHPIRAGIEIAYTRPVSVLARVS